MTGGDSTSIESGITPSPKPWTAIVLIFLCLIELWMFYRLPLSPIPPKAVNAMVLPFFPPYVLMLLRLFSPKQLKSGLALAVSFGSLAGLAALLLGVLAISNHAKIFAAYFLSMAAVQAALVWVSIKTYRGFPRGSGDSTILVRNILGACTYMFFAFCIVMAAPNLASGKD